MENINIEVLPRNYWINGDKPVIVYKSKSLKQETANIVALIISCVTETFSELVEILENYLKEKKISRRQFCALVDIPNSTISSWKAKKVLPSIELVAKVAKFMNVSLDWLV